MPRHDCQHITVALILCAALGCSKHVESNEEKAPDVQSSASPEAPKTNPTTEAAIVTHQTARRSWVRVAQIDSVQRYPTGGTAAASPPPDVTELMNLNVVSFLNDDTLLVADGKDGIRLFNATNGRQRGRFGAPLADVTVSESQRRVFASPDGRLATILPDREPKIWQTDTGTCVAVLPRFGQSYMLAAFYPDGKHFATIRGKSYFAPPPINLHLWELTDGPPRELAAGRASFQTTSLIYCAPYLLADGPVLTVHDPKTLDRLKDGWPEGGNVRLLWSQPQTEKLAAEIGTVQLGAIQASADSTDPVTIDETSLEDGRKLKSSVCPQEMFEKDRNDNGLSRSYRVSPDHRVVAVSRGGRVEFFQLDGWKRLWAVDSSRSSVVEVTFLPQFRVVLSNAGTAFRIYDFRTGRILTEIPALFNSPGDVYSSSGNCVAIHAAAAPVRSGTMTSDFGKIEIWRQRDAD